MNIAILSRFAAVAAIGLSAASAARGNIIINVTQDTAVNTVTLAYTGSLDPTGSGFTHVADGTTSAQPLINSSGINICPDTPSVSIYNTGSTPYFTSFSTSGGINHGTFISGNPLVLASNGANPNIIELPQGYVANTVIAGADRFTGSFASLQITPTPYTMTLPGNQTISVQFATVPEPATIGVAAMTAGVALLRRRRV